MRLTPTRLIYATACFLVLFCYPVTLRASDLPPDALRMQPHISVPLQKVGTSTYRKFGFTVYRAVLWAPNGKWDAAQPYALELRYARSLSQETLADSIIDNIRDENVADEATLARWSTGIKKTMHAVEDGDVMVGVVTPGVETVLYLNGTEIGRTKDQALTRAFFNIWLGDNADEDMRKGLLGQSD